MGKFKYKLKRDVFLFLVTMFENAENFNHKNVAQFISACVLMEMREKLLQKAVIYKDEYSVSWKPYEAAIFWYIFNPAIEEISFIEPYAANAIQAMNNEIHKQIISHYNLIVK